MSAALWIEETRAMSDFAGALKNPDLGVIKADAMKTCGGLPECGALATGVNELFTQGLAFLTDVDRGFTAFKDIVAQCQSDYLSNDTTQAEKIATTAHHASGEDYLPGLVGTPTPSGGPAAATAQPDGIRGVLEPLLQAGNAGGPR
jgi:hypothetical protein